MPFVQEYLLSRSTSYHSGFCYKNTLNFAMIDVKLVKNGIDALMICKILILEMSFPFSK